MPSRPSWQGYLKVSLVTCPVKLYRAATDAPGVSFHLLDAKTHHRIQMKPVDPGRGEVERKELVHGYEISKGRYVVVEDEDLEKVRLKTTKTIEIEEFVDADAVDPLYYDTPYYLVPNGDTAAEAYTVIREAMRAENKVGIAQLVISRRERTIAIAPRGRGILVTALHQVDQIADEKKTFAGIPAEKPDKDMIDIARRIVGQKAAKFDPADFKDHYEQALRRLIEARAKGKTVAEQPEPEETKVVDLMAALKASLKGAGGRAPHGSEQRDNVVPLRRPAHAKHRAAKKPSRQRRRHA